MKTQTKVVLEALQKAGFNIRIDHFRAIKPVTICYSEFLPIRTIQEMKVFETGPITIVPNECGGSTKIALITPTGQTYSIETLVSKRDHFCRKTGVKIGLGRLIKAMIKDGIPLPNHVAD